MLASILINNYNYGAYIGRCIVSLLEQTYKNIEIIVYDDGSTDNSLEVLSQYENIQIIAKPNYGMNHNLNQMNAVYQAFLKSKGEYVFLLDSDDYFREDKVEKVIEAFTHYEDVEVVQHSLEEVDCNDQSFKTIVPVLKKVHDFKKHIVDTQSLFHIFSTTSALAFKRSFLEKILPLEEDNLPYLAVDTRLMVIASLISKIHTIHEPLTFYRKHGFNNSNRLGDIDAHKQYTEDLYRFFNKNAVKYQCSSIHYNESQYLENTFFFNDIDLSKCNEFLKIGDYWIWGAGEAGQSVYHALKARGASCRGFIDSDPKKHNAKVMNKTVISPNEVVYNEKIRIIISPYHAYPSIEKVLQEKSLIKGIHFIDPYFRKE